MDLAIRLAIVGAVAGTICALGVLVNWAAPGWPRPGWVGRVWRRALGGAEEEEEEGQQQQKPQQQQQ